MSFNLPTDSAVVVATIDPDVSTAAAYTSDWVEVENFHQFQAIVMAGTLGTGATIDAVVQQATDGSGTGAATISGKSITQMTQAGTDQSDTQAVINVNSDEVSDGFTHIAVKVTVGTATSDMGALIIGMTPRYGPASDSDLASVGEIVS